MIVRLLPPYSIRDCPLSDVPAGTLFYFASGEPMSLLRIEDHPRDDARFCFAIVLSGPTPGSDYERGKAYAFLSTSPCRIPGKAMVSQ